HRQHQGADAIRGRGHRRGDRRARDLRGHARLQGSRQGGEGWRGRRRVAAPHDRARGAPPGAALHPRMSLAKRIIPCLDVAGGRVVKGVRFENLRDVGDPIELATRYSDLAADELVFLDITATIEGRKTMLEVVERAAAELEIPFTVGGGVSGVGDGRALLLAGAD